MITVVLELIKTTLYLVNKYFLPDLVLYLPHPEVVMTHDKATHIILAAKYASGINMGTMVPHYNISSVASFNR